MTIKNYPTFFSKKIPKFCLKKFSCSLVPKLFKKVETEWENLIRNASVFFQNRNLRNFFQIRKNNNTFFNSFLEIPKIYFNTSHTILKMH